MPFSTWKVSRRNRSHIEATTSIACSTIDDYHTIVSLSKAKMKPMSEPGTLSMRQTRRSFTGRLALLVATAVSSLGGFLFGYDNIVISGAIGHLAKYFQLAPASIGWAAGCALIGCLLGS